MLSLTDIHLIPHVLVQHTHTHRPFPSWFMPWPLSAPRSWRRLSVCVGSCDGHQGRLFIPLDVPPAPQDGRGQWRISAMFPRLSREVCVSSINLYGHGLPSRMSGSSLHMHTTIWWLAFQRQWVLPPHTWHWGWSLLEPLWGYQQESTHGWIIIFYCFYFRWDSSFCRCKLLIIHGYFSNQALPCAWLCF